MKNAYKALAGQLRKRSYVSRRLELENNINVDAIETGCEGLD
jgi:hypothetical protein